MRKLLFIALLLPVVVLADNTEFYANPSIGTNTHSGSTTNQVPAYQAVNGGWNSGTGVFTPASGDPSASVAVGDWASVYTDGATVTPFVGRVTGVNATTITISTAIKGGTAPGTAGSGISCTVGGAWAGPRGASSFPFGVVAATMTNTPNSTPRVNFRKSTNYVFNVPLDASQAGPIVWEGYDDVPGDIADTLGATPVKFYCHTNGAFTLYTGLTLSGNNNQVIGLWLDWGGRGTGGTATNGLIILRGTGSFLKRVRATSAWRTGIQSIGGGTILEDCEAYSCNADDASDFGGFRFENGALAYGCLSYSNNFGTDSEGFVVVNASAGEYYHFSRCIAWRNGKNGFSLLGNSQATIEHSIIMSNAADGVRINSDADNNIRLRNNIIMGNGGFGLNAATVTAAFWLSGDRNAFKDNASGNFATFYNQEQFTRSITLTADPFLNAAAGSFGLNSTAGGGALLRWGVTNLVLQGFNSGSTTNFLDIGAAQHMETGSAPAADPVTSTAVFVK
jgi:hypothetical protein